MKSLPSLLDWWVEIASPLFCSAGSSSYRRQDKYIKISVWELQKYWYSYEPNVSCNDKLQRVNVSADGKLIQNNSG